MRRHRAIAFLLFAFAITLPPTATRGADNALSEQETKEGWLLLFDGRSTRGWMSPSGRPAGPEHVQGDSLNPHPCDYMLVYEKPVSDFELALDFKISPGCNTGVFVRTAP